MFKKIFLTMLCTIALVGCREQNVSDKAYLRSIACDSSTYTFAFFSDIEPVSVSASDLSTAKESAELLIGREIFTGHTQLILLRDCDRRELLSYMLRHWHLSPSCMALTVSTEPADILKEHDTEELVGRVRIAVKQEKIPQCDIITVLEAENAPK